MPFRAMFSTIITVALALLAVGMWIRAVEPMLAAAGAAATEPSSKVPLSDTQPTTHPESTPEHSLKLVVQGTLLLSFLLICLLLVVGFFATFREWVRYRLRSHDRRQGNKTRFVDAWKIAGERLEPPSAGQEDEE